jgi:hypothetical protein
VSALYEYTLIANGLDSNVKRDESNVSPSPYVALYIIDPQVPSLILSVNESIKIDN